MAKKSRTSTNGYTFICAFTKSEIDKLDEVVANAGDLELSRKVNAARFIAYVWAASRTTRIPE